MSVLAPGRRLAPSELCLAAQVALAALLLLLISEQVHPLLPLLLALAFPFSARWRHDLGLIPHAAWVALPVGLSFAVWPVAARGGQQFHGSFHSACAGLLLAAAQLHARPSPARSGWVFLGTGLTIMATAIGMPSYVGRFGLGRLTLEPRPLYELVTLLWAAAAAGALRGELTRPAPLGQAGAGRRRAGGTVAATVCALMTLGLTWGLVRVIEGSYDELTQVYFRLLEGAPLRSAGGFSDQAQLGSLTDQIGPEAQAVAVRSFSAGPPGYLRGKAFQSYTEGRWTVRLVAREVELRGGRVGLPGREPPPPQATRDLEVYPASEYGAHFFLPLEASAVATACERVAMTEGGALRSASQPTSRGYDVFLARETPWIEGLSDPGWLELPTRDPELMRALDELIAAQELAGLPPPQVVARLASFFDRTYTCKVGIQFRPGSDPLVQWLREKRHGHCELFASAGTLLLRRLGVPARYVTGFICSERHPWEPELWVARRAHAHAWIEWAHPQRGWQVAELTPASAIAGPTPGGWFTHLREWLSARWDQLSGAFRDGLAGVPRALLGLVSAFAAWVAGAWWRGPLLMLSILAWPLWRRLRTARRARAVARAGSVLPPEVEAERRRFLALEQRLRRVGLGRHAGETLLEYAGRLERAAELPPGVARGEALALVRGFALRRYAPSR